MKLEELEMTFKNGATKKIWKVNRPKPEAVETVDFVSFHIAVAWKSYDFICVHFAPYTIAVINYCF